MSIFYLTPAKGDMPMYLLEDIVIKRLESLKSVINGNNLAYNEYLIEGSVYDNVGHFMLCIIAILGENNEFCHFFQKAETELFKLRIGCLSSYDLRCFAKKMLRCIKKYEPETSYITPLHIICQHLVLKYIAQHISQKHSNECDMYNIKVHFKHCLSFVSRRQVELTKGVATVPCGLWKQYLMLLFIKNLNQRLNTNLSPIQSDPRIEELLHKINKIFIPNLNEKMNILKSRDVDSASNLFPPCMLNLHRKLRQRHRLSHSQRFYYSLFLKDIGMPVEEAIDFWRTEYRLTPRGSHSCCHSWEKDEKKFLYGIRHMYGLEGGRKNYTSVSCQRIQSIDNACTEGGCPFKSFDNINMVKLISKPTEALMSQIYEYKNRNQFTSACMLTLKERENFNTFSFNFNPVKYYMISSKTSPVCT
ncbi:DNA primase large subunit-like [Manduca sexta]|uniref:DNA primase large subunit-like n=1 Tax=Manduca sexta TaxID=7130 RepID=UPI0018903941|nr:DNA primase large subunit-like [Manduca sexta]